MIWLLLGGLLALGAVVVALAIGSLWLLYEYATAPLVDEDFKPIERSTAGAGP